jgi:uncharacterized protein YdcH (DUF465 family)
MENTTSITEMIRQVSTNNANFFNAIADHIDQLHSKIAELETEIEQLKNPVTPDE